jgi:DNA (cytosine-5)-methyltransferase 1
MTWTVGGLFAGIGGLELALSHFDCLPLWFAEHDPSSKKQHPSSVLAARFPGVPNLGSVTEIDFTKVPKVDVLAGGFPCQDVSAAGKRKGIGEATRTGLWAEFVRAIRDVEPRWVVVENVAGLLTPVPARGGDGEIVGYYPAPLEAVLRDLAEAGFDAEWTVLRAADAGAPHNRARIFVLAWHSDAGEQDAIEFLRGRSESDAGGSSSSSPESPDPECQRCSKGRDAPPQGVGGTRRHEGPVPAPLGEPLGRGAGGASSAAAADGTGGKQHRCRVDLIDGSDGGRREGAGISTGCAQPPPDAIGEPVRNRTGDVGDAAGSGEGEGSERQRIRAYDRAGRAVSPPDPARDGGGAHGDGAPDLRTTVADAAGERRQGPTGHGDVQPPDGSAAFDWREFTAAIRRWERILNRPPPHPLIDNKLSHHFVEWMQGLPEGHVTDVLDRRPALKALGNCVVPQQAALALAVIGHRLTERAA